MTARAISPAPTPAEDLSRSPAPGAGPAIPDTRGSEPPFLLVSTPEPPIPLVRGPGPGATLGLSSHPVIVSTGNPTTFYPRSVASEAHPRLEEIDRAFFAREAETVARLQAEATDEVWIEREAPPAPSREVLVRRGRLRGFVGLVVGALALLVGPIAGQALGFSHRHSWADLPVTSVHAAASPASLALADEEEEETPLLAGHAAVATPALSAASALSAATTASTAPEASRGRETASPEATGNRPSEAAPAPRAAEADPARARGLSTRALGRLEAGKYREAIELATGAIEADPSDAAPYLYKGAALLETGKRAEAREVFVRCVAQATRGQKQECRQLQ